MTSSQKVISYRNFLAEDRFATEAKKTQKLVILELQFISNAFFLSEKKKVLVERTMNVHKFPHRISTFFGVLDFGFQRLPCPILQFFQFLNF